MLQCSSLKTPAPSLLGQPCPGVQTPTSDLAGCPLTPPWSRWSVSFGAGVLHITPQTPGQRHQEQGTVCLEEAVWAQR